MPSCNPLPAKENSNFKRVLKCYEQKQYKHGLKFAKQILSNPKFAEHGETLSMKGLILNCLGRKEEAYELVKKGLRNDLKSHVCWHVYGLLQRSDRKYTEAIRCYQNALKWDKENMQILRDLSLLQVQTRDLEGFKDTRYQLLVLRPGQKASWIGYAMSFHLMDDYDMSLKVLEEYSTQQTQFDKNYDFEHSELLLYKVQIMRDAAKMADSKPAISNGVVSGDDNGNKSHSSDTETEENGQKDGNHYRELALNLINDNASYIVDRITMEETKAELLLELGKKHIATPIYKSLIERNPANWSNYTGLEKALSLETEDQRMEIYEKVSSEHPRALVPKTLPLNFLTGERFRKSLDQLMRQMLHKGVPPLFAILRPLYVNKSKAKIIEELLTMYVTSLKEVETFDKNDDTLELESPTSLLWTYYFLAQHYDLIGDTKKALDYINTALEHTLTLVELFVCKARIYKHAGNIQEAVACLDEAQSLDTADRYINSKCAKYMLRADKISDAEAMCAKFTREGVSAIDDLNQMQCMWFQTECAYSYYKQGKYGDALKKCHEIDRHFTEIIDDQFDFHTYCMRKMTLRSYIDLLRLEDVLRQHPFFYKAAIVAVKIYIELYDNPSKNESDELNESMLKMTEAERKKAKSKARKREILKQQQEQDDKKKGGDKKKDTKKASEAADLDGPKEVLLVPEKLCRPKNPLEEAIKFLKPLQNFAGQIIETHLLAFKIYFRLDKVMLMLQSIKRAFKVDENNAELHYCIIIFLHYVENIDKDKIEPVLLEVLNEEISKLLNPKNMKLTHINEVFLAKNSTSHLHRLNVAKAMRYLEPKKSSQVVAVASSMQCDDITLKGCIETLKFLKSGDDLSKFSSESYLKQCQDKFQFSTAFNENPPTPNPNNTLEISNVNSLIEDMDTLAINSTS